MAASCSFVAEGSWGPGVATCRRPFDVTLLFEQAVFQLLPSTIFLALIALRLTCLIRQPVRFLRRRLYALEVTVSFASVCLSLVQLALTYLLPGGSKTSLSAAAVSLDFLAACALLLVVPLEHTRSIQPSFLVACYLAIVILLRAALTRTYRHLEGYFSITWTSLATVLVQLCLLVLETCQKTRHVGSSGQAVSSEETASFLSRSLFIWLDRLLVTGYRHPLKLEELGPIDRSLSSELLAARFGTLSEPCANPQPTRLLITTLLCLGSSFWFPVIPRLCLTAFLFCQPFLASSIIAYLNAGGSTGPSPGYGLIGAAALIYLGIAICNGWYWHLSYKAMTKLRGGLVASVSQKMFRSWRGKDAESHVLTLIISDVQRITGTLVFFHDIWITPIETAIGTWLLWRQIGPPSLTVLAIALVCTAASTYAGKGLVAQQGRWLSATQKRIGATGIMLSSLKAIKVMGLDHSVGKSIEKLRELEFSASKMFRQLLIATLFSSHATLTLAPVLAFGCYIAVAKTTGADLTTSRLFSSLILIGLISGPLTRILQVLPSFGAMLGSFARLQQFFQGEEIQFDLRQPPRHREPHGTGSDNMPMGTIRNPIVTLRDVDLGWNKDAPLLRRVSMLVTSGQNVTLSGAVGSGKTLLLTTILGEVEPLSGSLCVRDVTIGYCSQTPWVENLPAWQSAFRFQSGDEAWLRSVSHACVLEELFESQAPGETVGSGGSKTSGGEKQRLALARAVAARPALLLLDDIFSSIDNTTKHIINERLFGPQGLLRALGTTVIHVTQDPIFQQSADNIWDIHEEAGLRLLLSPKSRGTPKDSTPTTAGIDATVNNTLLPKNGKSPGHDTKEKEHEAPTIISDSQVYRVYIGSIGRAHMVIFLATGVVTAFFLRFPDLWVKWWSVAESSGPGATNTRFWMGIYALLGVLPLIFLGLWATHLLLVMIPKSGLGLHRRMLDTVLGASFVYINAIDTGGILNRFNQDLMFIDMKLPLDLLNTTSALFQGIMQIVLVVVAVLYSLAVLPVVFTALYVIQRFYLRTSKQLRQLDLESKAGLHTKVTESFAGLVTIRAHGWQDAFQKELQEKLDVSQAPVYLLWIAQTWLQMVLNLLVAALAIIVIGAAVGTRLNANASASALGVALLNIVSLGDTLKNLMTAWTSLETSMGAIARIESFTKTTPLERRVANPIGVSATWPRNGGVKFDRVSASYDASHSKTTWSLRDVSFDLRSGEKLAVCGRSGSGKSTLLLSILGLMEQSSGTITLDGVDINLVDPTLLISRIHVISQDSFIQGTTFREALDPEDKLSDEIIVDVLDECGLLGKLADTQGLSTPLKDVTLSAGEAQLLALARTILGAQAGACGLVLFDEATSSIDVATEARIMRIIRQRLGGTTVVSILHRLETALQYDRIAVLERGELVHFGTPGDVVRDAELFASVRSTT
ncbi:putative ATP-binding cassette transporter [Coniochaeta ligniaria NRRL 30616]|uniref:Putative ATP-binding cassette transporter n=1 Tax=Coniochaeta ligniaria NRRL 30616 TaxID=1408157 RepID=A0A1J7J1L7_9PEZI|nr:putative ATP-binding cassette transporter [Coniochaeta ligniaria NRRL 30616]